MPKTQPQHILNVWLGKQTFWAPDVLLLGNGFSVILCRVTTVPIQGPTFPRQSRGERPCAELERPFLRSVMSEAAILFPASRRA